MADTSERLVALGWGDRVAASYGAVAGPGCVAGRVVRVERAAGMVATGDGDVLARAPMALAVGDWVAVETGDGDPTVAAVVDRWSQLTRRDPTGRTQLLASNIDVVFVTAPADRLSESRVEREVAMGWDSGAVPVVLVTKCDLADAEALDALRGRLLGVDVVATSTVTGEGVDEVASMLAAGRTAVLLGPSGAGKSSIVNRLLGEERMATAPVRDADHRGRHTTSVRQLHVVPSGGCLIDTPGLRSLSMSADHGGVDAAFPDIVALAAGCRFDDCAHEHEPGCAVLAASEAGDLDPRRLANYQKLERELGFEARRDDPLARSEAERIWKIRAKAARKLRTDG